MLKIGERGAYEKKYKAMFFVFVLARRRRNMMYAGRSMKKDKKMYGINTNDLDRFKCLIKAERGNETYTVGRKLQCFL